MKAPQIKISMRGVTVTVFIAKKNIQRRRELMAGSTARNVQNRLTRSTLA
jgi:hypothetical protein